jgi:hypothetical protein
MVCTVEEIPSLIYLCQDLLYRLRVGEEDSLMLCKFLNATLKKCFMVNSNYDRSQSPMGSYNRLHCLFLAIRNALAVYMDRIGYLNLMGGVFK